MTKPNYEECVKFALTHKGIIGDSFKDTDLIVYERRIANPSTLFTSLSKGGIVIPIVNASLFGINQLELSSTVVVKANHVTGMVDLYVPGIKDIESFPIEAFMESWITAGGVCITAFPADPKTYRPNIIDLDNIILPKGIEELREAIAKNVHDRWALERQSEGWTYGYKRDDSKLETPDMVPYTQLSESEKQYDRIMAEDTIKLLIALGYKIEKNL